MVFKDHNCDMLAPRGEDRNAEHTEPYEQYLEQLLGPCEGIVEDIAEHDVRYQNAYHRQNKDDEHDLHNVENNSESLIEFFCHR